MTDAVPFDLIDALVAALAATMLGTVFTDPIKATLLGLASYAVLLVAVFTMFSGGGGFGID